MDAFSAAKKLIEEFKKEIKEFELKKQKLVSEIGSKPFLEAFKVLNSKVPEITNVYWTQYTPHWNDGEECFFSVNGWNYNVTINDKSIESEYGDLGYFEYIKTAEEIDRLKIKIKETKEKYEKDYQNWVKVGMPKYQSPYKIHEYYEDDLEKSVNLTNMFSEGRLLEIKKALDEFGNFMRSVPEELYKDIFGDHCLVVITDKNVDIEEYSHD